jgi:ubiquinone/menaquinone biosynthesis C-methylase UbiE
MPGSQDSTKFKARDASSYDSLTSEFDRFTQRLTEPMAERLLLLAGLAPSDRVLDLGTGTGIVALLAAGKSGFRGRITGVDLSQGMLAVAQAKASQNGLSNRLEFCRMDAEALALEDASFDVALSLFALLHFPNPLSALREVFRVLRPGGKLALAVGSGPPLFSGDGAAEGVKFLRRTFAVQRGKLLLAPRSLDDFVTRRIPEREEPEESSLAREGRNRSQKVPQLIRQAGFAGARTTWCGAENVVQTPEEFWEVQRTFSSIVRKRLLNVTPEKIEALRNEFLEACRKVQSRGGRLIYPFAALFVVAQRPPV